MNPESKTEIGLFYRNETRIVQWAWFLKKPLSTFNTRRNKYKYEGILHHVKYYLLLSAIVTYSLKEKYNGGS